jgi:hypothetical protein
MIQTDLRLSAKFQRVVQDNNTFQQGIWAELDTLRNFSWSAKYFTQTLVR